ncbi:MAG: M13 family metallopeptidase [Myxococcaceae bacterium]
MRRLPLLLCLALGTEAPAEAPPADKPLAQLPYTPSLDVSAMDRSADPCVDFYAFTCGGWQRSNPIPADQAGWSVYAKLQTDTQRYLWGLLADASKPQPGRDAVTQQVGDFFAACMDEAAVEKLGRAPLAADLETLAGLKDVSGLSRWLGAQHRLDSGRLFFGVGSQQDASDATRVIGAVSADGLGLPDRDYYLKTDARSVAIRERYLQHVAKMLELSGEEASQAAREAKVVLGLETELAKASLSRVDRRDPYKVFHKMPVQKLKALAPAVDWEGYFTALGAKGLAELNVTEPSFFEALSASLKKHPLEDWKAYARWHVVSSRAPLLSSAFVNENFAFYRKYLRGVEVLQPRWKRCVTSVDNNLGEALGQLFVQRNFSPELKARARAMVVAIQKEMERDLQTLPWMEEATRAKALEKLHAMANKIGYPDKWRDYAAVRIRREDFYGDVLRASAFETARVLGKIGKPVDRSEWGMTPVTVNAYYDPQLNDMNFPAAVLQPPLYDARLDDAPNYGDTGGTIGHELTHGFDDEGRQFDAQGNLRDWWTKKDAQEFLRRAGCVSDEYSSYLIVDDIHINGKLTLGEDVADLGGTLLAYRAWKRATAASPLQPSDGLTPEQRFFVGYAQWACSNERPEDLRVRAVTNPHSPAKWRVNGVMVNIPEFAQAFTCKPGQPMAKPPEKVCTVW